MVEINHPDWLNKGPWYNTSICSRLHGSLFEYYITNTITNRYNIMCSIVAHDLKKPAGEYDESGIGDRLIPKHVTIEALYSMGDTLNLIENWIKILDNNYDARRVSYSTSMKDMFKQIPTTMT